MQLRELTEIESQELFYLLEDLFKINMGSLRKNTEYYRAYYSDFKDLSFCVYSSDFSSLVLFLVYKINGKLTFDESGAKIFIRDHSQKQCIKTALNHIESYFNETATSYIHISSYLREGSLSVLDTMLLAQGYSSKIIFGMSVSSKEYNLKLYHSSIRKSYKSLINWGKKNMSLNYVNKNNPDKKSFDSFRHFHAKISKNVTRSLESWNIQYDMICDGYGELSLGYKDDNLVTGILALRQLDKVCYAVGVHERELFNYGISHYILYDSISRNLSEKNNLLFSLGYYDTELKDDKISNINFFKKGFCPKLKPIIVWYNEK
jgi:hypothetical protein